MSVRTACTLVTHRCRCFPTDVKMQGVPCGFPGKTPVPTFPGNLISFIQLKDMNAMSLNLEDPSMFSRTERC